MCFSKHTKKCKKNQEKRSRDAFESVPQEIPDKKRFISFSLILCLLPLSNDSFVTERLKEKQKIRNKKRPRIRFLKKRKKMFVTLTIKHFVFVSSSLKGNLFESNPQCIVIIVKLCVEKSERIFMDFFLGFSFVLLFVVGDLRGLSWDCVTLTFQHLYELKFKMLLCDAQNTFWAINNALYY